MTVIRSLISTACRAARRVAPAPAATCAAIARASRCALATSARRSWACSTPLKRIVATPRPTPPLASIATSSRRRSEASRASTSALQAVADTPQRAQPEGLAKLAPQGRDVDVDRLRLVVDRAPDGAQQRLPAVNSLGLA